ncbi:hypothetical protein [Paracoccus marcusii]
MSDDLLDEIEQRAMAERILLNYCARRSPVRQQWIAVMWRR